MDRVDSEQDAGKHGKVLPQAGDRRADAGEKDAGGRVEDHVGRVKPERTKAKCYVVKSGIKKRRETRGVLVNYVINIFGSFSFI